MVYHAARFRLTTLLMLVMAPGIFATEFDQPIKAINAKPNAGIFQSATRNQPLTLTSKSAAEKHFDQAELGKLLGQVDFEKQLVIVFAWRGSGQDRLTYDVAESYPEQIFFRYQPGRTKDLRPHVHVFALRSNVVWRTPDGNAGKLTGNETDEYIRVEVQGKLNTLVAAIGGETTGVTISANDITWELDLGDRPDLRREAKQRHGKTVVVKGDLEVKTGVEIRRRWIVKVSSLTDAKSASDSNRKSGDRN